MIVSRKLRLSNIRFQLSQYEKSVDIYYSLRVYATCEFSLTPMPDFYNPKYDQEISGEWKGKTAGGCPNHLSTFKNNPLYQFELNNFDATNFGQFNSIYKKNRNRFSIHIFLFCSVKIELRAPKQFQVGFEVCCTSTKNDKVPGAFQKTESGNYRSGFSVLTLDNIPGGTYTIRPATFEPNKESAFHLKLSSSHPFTLTKLQ